MASHATFASKWKWLDWEVEEMQMQHDCTLLDTVAGQLMVQLGINAGI